jgi:hypothetical protein
MSCKGDQIVFYGTDHKSKNASLSGEKPDRGAFFMPEYAKNDKQPLNKNVTYLTGICIKL